MTIEELRAMEWYKASRFYGDSPDSQWDTEAQFACLLMPEILALVEAANKMRGQVNEVTDEIVWLDEAIEAFNAKLESL